MIPSAGDPYYTYDAQRQRPHDHSCPHPVRYTDGVCCPPQLNGQESAVLPLPRHQLDRLTREAAWRLAQQAPAVARHTGAGVSGCELELHRGLGGTLRLRTEAGGVRTEGEDEERREVLRKREERRREKKEKRERRRARKEERERAAREDR